MMDLLQRPSPDPDDSAQYKGSWHWGDQEMIRVVFSQLEDKWNTIDGMMFVSRLLSSPSCLSFDLI